MDDKKLPPAVTSHFVGTPAERQPKSTRDLVALIEGHVRDFYGHNPVVRVTKIDPRTLRVAVGGDTPARARAFRISVSGHRR